MRTEYEWALEEKDEHDNIKDANHAKTFAEVNKWSQYCKHFDIVLVRDVMDDMGGVTDRSWAYIKDGKLGTHFMYSDNSVGSPIPKKFLAEVQRYQSLKRQAIAPVIEAVSVERGA